MENYFDYLNLLVSTLSKIKRPATGTYSEKKLKRIKEYGFPLFSKEVYPILLEREQMEMEIASAIMMVEQEKRMKLVELWKTYKEKCRYDEFLRLCEHPDHFVDTTTGIITISRCVSVKNELSFLLVLLLSFGPGMTYVLLSLFGFHSAIGTMQAFELAIFWTVFAVFLFGYAVFLSYRLKPYILAKRLQKK